MNIVLEELSVFSRLSVKREVPDPTITGLAFFVRPESSPCMNNFLVENVIG